MSANETYQPKYPVGYEYKAGNTIYFIEKIEKGMYYERCSSTVAYVVTRCDVFDANHRLDKTSVSLGIGLAIHPESKEKK
jgi:hypothetical protein